mmetsp:Transcript_25058/g.48668  ORF Transcript_25058/g.48668 Transcript_25058/m.48668 type:complete len:132 (+) Transcript_25058:875-1270(+)
MQWDGRSQALLARRLAFKRLAVSSFSAGGCEDAAHPRALNAGVAALRCVSVGTISSALCRQRCPGRASRPDGPSIPVSRQSPPLSAPLWEHKCIEGDSVCTQRTLVRPKCMLPYRSISAAVCDDQQASQAA